MSRKSDSRPRRSNNPAGNAGSLARARAKLAEKRAATKAQDRAEPSTGHVPLDAVEIEKEPATEPSTSSPGDVVAAEFLRSERENSPSPSNVSQSDDRNSEPTPTAQDTHFSEHSTLYGFELPDDSPKPQKLAERVLAEIERLHPAPGAERYCALADHATAEVFQALVRAKVCPVCSKAPDPLLTPSKRGKGPERHSEFFDFGIPVPGERLVFKADRLAPERIHANGGPYGWKL